MFKKTLTAAVAALTFAGATLTTTSQAQAGGLGKRRQRPRIPLAGRRVQLPHGPRLRGWLRRLGFRNSPIFDECGNRIGARRVPAC